MRRPSRVAPRHDHLRSRCHSLPNSTGKARSDRGCLLFAVTLPAGTERGCGSVCRRAELRCHARRNSGTPAGDSHLRKQAGRAASRRGWLTAVGNSPHRANAKHCRCCWLLAASRSMPPPRPSSRSSAWSSQHPNPSESGSAARSLPRYSTPPRTCACTPPGIPRRPARWWRCGPWLVARTRC